MHRPRGAGAVLTQPPLPQAWVPRVVNGALGVFFLVVLAPVVGSLDGKDGHVQAAIVVFTVPFLLVAVMCLSSALRPGSVARSFRRLRRR